MVVVEVVIYKYELLKLSAVVLQLDVTIEQGVFCGFFAGLANTLLMSRLAARMLRDNMLPNTTMWYFWIPVLQICRRHSVRGKDRS